MKICLINPAVRTWAAPNCVPTGILLLSAVLKQEGYSVDILDLNGLRLSRDETRDLLKKADYDVYGVGGIVTSFQEIRWIIHTVKRHHPNSYVVAGGPVVTGMSKLFMNETMADVAVIGEGEAALRVIVESVDKLDKCPIHGLFNAFALIEDLDSLPLPDYENLSTLEIYLKNPIGYLNSRKWIDGKPTSEVKSMNIVTARGCPFNCKFCMSHYLGPGYRFRSPTNIVDEMKLLTEKYEVGYIHFTDELTFLNKERALALCDEIMKRCGGLAWGCPVRIDLVDREMLECMAAAGCVHIGTGVESFSSKMLEAMGKPMNVEKVKQNLRMAKEIISDVQYTLILGFPGETRETVDEQICGVETVGFRPENVFMATAYPGTWLYDYAQHIHHGYRTRQTAFIKDELSYLEALNGHEQHDLLLNFTELREEELQEARKIILGDGER